MLELNNSSLLKQLDLWNNRVLEAAARGVEKAADELGEEAERLAPKKEGSLRRSKKIRIDSKTGLRITATVSYSAIRRSKSGWNFDYAVYLHELSRFDPSTPGTGPKFLERPLKAKSRRFTQIVAEEVRKEFS